MFISYKKYTETINYIKIPNIEVNNTLINDICSLLNIDTKIKNNILISILGNLIENITKNSNIQIENDKCKIMLAIICLMAYCNSNKIIIYNESDYTKNIASILEELRLSGIGDILSEQISKCINLILDSSIENFDIKNILDSNILNLYIYKLNKHCIDNNVNIENFYTKYIDIINEIITHINNIGLDDFLKLLNSNKNIISTKQDKLLIDNKTIKKGL